MEDGHRRLYLVIEDFLHSFGVWGDGARFVPPDVIADCRERLYRALPRFVGARVKVFGEADFRRELNERVRQVARGLNGAYVVGMTHYVERSDASLQITRIAVPHEGSWKKIERAVARLGHPALEDRVAAIAAEAAGRPIVLVDDGFWSGQTVHTVIDLFSRHGCTIARVVLGIAADTTKISPDLLPLLEIVHSFPSSEGKVYDWICERDFYAGVPTSGRTLGNPDERSADERRIGIPYFLPHGDPIGWASVEPEAVVPFSALCLELSRRLFAALEQVSGRPVLVRDLQTIPYGLEHEPERSFLNALDDWHRRLTTSAEERRAAL